jgi:hypothetical protein
MAPETLSGEDKRKELQSIEKFELEPGGGLGGLGDDQPSCSGFKAVPGPAHAWCWQDEGLHRVGQSQQVDTWNLPTAVGTNIEEGQGCALHVAASGGLDVLT